MMPLQSLAYVGPGMAGGVLASVLGILAAFIIGIFGILYYPIKRAIRERKLASEKESASEDV